ncbi:MAG: hypothetical protein ACR2G5_05170 [Pyrinomonadaceae bacterium]
MKGAFSALEVNRGCATVSQSLAEFLSILAALTMHKRFLATTVLAVALPFSQGGNFLVAALCPHLQSGMTACKTQLAEPTMSHEDMVHMEMERETASNRDPDAVALGQPIGPCSHCAVHSRTNRNTASLSEMEAARRSADLNIPLPLSRVSPVSVSAVSVSTSRAHGPPGERTPRHILINIFRI